RFGQAGCRAALDALQLGAVEVLAKPGGPYSVGELRVNLANKVRAAAAARLSPKRPTAAPAASPVRHVPGRFSSATVIAIGASTGGTEAVLRVLEGMP